MPEKQPIGHEILSDSYLSYIGDLTWEQVDPAAYLLTEARLLKAVREGDDEKMYDFTAEYIQERFRLQTAVAGKRAGLWADIVKAQNAPQQAFFMPGGNGSAAAEPVVKPKKKGLSLNPFARRGGQ